MRRILNGLILLAGALLLPTARAIDAQSDIVGGVYDPDAGEFETLSVINLAVGADVFYDAGYFGRQVNIANVEAGHIWMGHDVFDRTGVAGLPPSPALPRIDGGGSLGELDFHATMVGHVLAGTGLTEDGDLSVFGAGMAPLATLWSGAIATSFSTDEENIGSFETSTAAFLVPYRAFFEGTTFVKGAVTQIVPRADVINSSWGYDDPAGTEEFTQLLDGLARANPTATLVKSAGNGGPASAPGGPGSGYNGITVGALGRSGDADPYLHPSTYTSSAPADFYNPVTGVTISGVRAGVSIAAPGDDLALAYYGGKTGSLADLIDVVNPATDLYFINVSGTSFASPIVAGGVALLKDMAYGAHFDSVAARDTRVVKSVLMASAFPTVGWDNGQHMVDGVITTTQALDYGVGAGRLDLGNAALIYVGGTTDVAGDHGGFIDPYGWDLGAVARGSANDYFFNLSFSGGLELDVSLNWFVNVNFDSLTETVEAQSFADLNLEVWTVAAGSFDTLVARSATLYNNMEFLRFDLPGAGAYGLRVTFGGVAYEQGGPLASETYGLAWLVGNPQVAAVPEPAEWGAMAAGFLIIVALARRVAIVPRRRGKFVSNAV